MKITNKKTSIAKRILLGTVVNILLMFVLAGFTIYNSGKAHDLTSSIVEGNYKITVSAKIIGKLIANMSEKDEKLLYLNKLSLEKDSTLQKIFNSNREEVERHLDKLVLLGRFIKNPITKETLEKIQSNFTVFCDNYYTKIKSIKANKPELLGNVKEISKHQIELVNSMQKAVISIIKTNSKTIEDKLKQLSEIEKRTEITEYWLVSVTLVFFIGFGYFIYSRIKKPIEILKHGTIAISYGKLGAQIEINSGDEFEELAFAFNKMSKKIKELDELKSEFIQVVTHELRTPLTSMKEANSLIKEEALGPVSPRQAKFLDITEQGINRLIKFIEDLLELSKAESSLYKVNKKEENLIELISENLLHLQGLIEEKRIKVINKFHKNLPKVKLDYMMISRVMTNLLSNAIKHSPQGGELRIDVGLRQGGGIDAKTVFGTLSENVPVVEVYVHDSGEGIDRENLSKVFSKFYQVKKTKNTKSNGIGLGLAISKEIILAHKGLIGAKSEPGKGTCFFLVLPVS